MNDFDRARHIRDAVLSGAGWKIGRSGDHEVRVLHLAPSLYVRHYQGEAKLASGIPAYAIELFVNDERELYLGWDENDEIWLHTYWPGKWEGDYFGLPARQGAG